MLKRSVLLISCTSQRFAAGGGEGIKDSTATLVKLY